MASTTYAKISEQISTIFFNGIPNDEARFSQRFIAELVAQEIASQARRNAFENSAQGETTYANDSFTSTFTNIAVSIDTVLNQKYSVLPSLPAALPNNQEIVAITPLGIKGRRRQIIMMKNKDKFMQDLIGVIRGTILAYIENGRLYYDNVQEYMFEAVNIVMVGAISTTGNLLDGQLNVPKSSEKDIINSVLQQLSQIRVPQDLINDSVDRPTA